MNEDWVEFVFSETKPRRIDQFLVQCLPDFSRTRLQTLIKNGDVLVDGDRVVKNGQILEYNQSIRIRLPATRIPTSLVAEDIPLQILFENDDVLVIDKTAGIVVHPAVGHSSGTLVNAVLAHAPDLAGIGGERRPGVVHRLDKDTSGVLLMAKNDHAYRFLQDQFHSRQVQKTYIALVDGAPPTPVGRIEAAIARDAARPTRMAVVPDEDGRAATSTYKTIERFMRHTLLEVHPLSGRTHQVRLHMAFLGCPIVGDTTYGRRQPTLPLKRHFLHALRLVITLPGESETRTFEAPLPGDLVIVLDRLRSPNYPASISSKMYL